MNFDEIFRHGVKLVKSNRGEILKAGALVGFGVTTYLTAKASYRTGQNETMEELTGRKDDPEITKRDEIRGVVSRNWKEFIPAGAAGAFTVACMVGASRVEAGKTTAALTAYTLGEKALAEYREKVVEKIGEKKELEVRDEIRADKVKANPPTPTLMIAEDKTLCLDAHTGRYFETTMQDLKAAENQINLRINHEKYVSVNEFYEEVGLDSTSGGEQMGWTFEQLMELSFTTAMDPNGRPCLVFDFSYVRPL